MSGSVGEDFPKEQERVRNLAQFGREIPSGFFYVAVCEAALRAADEAVISGDLVAILAAYQAMKEIQE